MTSVEQPIGMGIVGLGMAGAVMVRAAREHPGVELRAAADPFEAPRAALERDVGVPAHSDIRGLCDDPLIEAIYIATPHQFYMEHARLAAQSGKHVILEKPMALTLADCDAIIEAADLYRMTRAGAWRPWGSRWPCCSRHANGARSRCSTRGQSRRDTDRGPGRNGSRSSADPE